MSALPLCATCENALASFEYVWGTDKPQVCCAGCLPGLVDGADRYRRTFSAQPLPLIAAAPELLEASKAALMQAGESPTFHWPTIQDGPNWINVKMLLERAIAKAEGTSPGRANQSSEPTQPTEAKHKFANGGFGIADRPCSHCGLPDRDPIHSTEAKS